MKYIKEYNSFDKSDLIEQINDILLELSDKGFFNPTTTLKADKTANAEIEPGGIAPAYHGGKQSGFSFIEIRKYGNSDTIPFHFNEISEVVYRIKDLVSIRNIWKFYLVLNYSRTKNLQLGDNDQLENESLDGDILLKSFTIFFKFTI